MSNSLKFEVEVNKGNNVCQYFDFFVLDSLIDEKFLGFDNIREILVNVF